MRASFPIALGLRLLRGKAGTARYLRGSVLGIALSLVPLIVVMEVSTGMIEGITARLIEVGTYHLQAALSPSTSPQALARVTSDILGSGAAQDVIPERQGTGLLAAAGGSAGVTLRCVPSDIFSRDSGLARLVRIRAGSADLAGPDSLLLSGALARQLGVGAGDMVSLLTPFSEDMRAPPRITRMTVRGIFETGYQELDKLYAYTSLQASWSILSPRASRTFVGIKVGDPFASLARAERTIARSVPDAVRIYSWRELEYARLASFQTTKALLLFIMALIVLVAGVNVSSSVIAIAFERRFEIGILKSVGATSGSLALSFLMAGFVTGLLGTVAGISLGLLAAVNINELLAALQWIVNAALKAFSVARSGLLPAFPPVEPFTLFNSSYYLESIPVRIRPAEVTMAAAGTLLLSCLASYLPARQAARARPLAIIRKV